MGHLCIMDRGKSKKVSSFTKVGHCGWMEWGVRLIVSSSGLCTARMRFAGPDSYPSAGRTGGCASPPRRAVSLDELENRGWRHD